VNDADPFELYRAGLKLHRAKDYAGAVAQLELAVAADPRLADAWEALGVIYDKLGRLDEAIAATEKLVELQPDEVMPHTNLSRFYVKKGLKEKAELEQGKARLIGWKQELAQGGAAKANELQQAQAPSAEPQAPSIVSFLDAPAAPSAPPTAAPLASSTEALAKKIEQFEKLVAHNAQDVLSRFTLGRAYLEARRFDDAVRTLEELLTIKTDYTAAFVLLGDAYEGGGKIARAIKTWKRGVELAQSKGDLHPRNQMQERLARLGVPG
jgi:tetratricopeptide (TPR) repeat protein